MKDIFEIDYSDSFHLFELAIDDGWRTIRTVPLAGQGQFLGLTIRGLIRVVKTRSNVLRVRPRDGYGPERVTVKAVASGNYLAAIAWKPIKL